MLFVSLRRQIKFIMTALDKKIVAFIKKHHVLTLASSNNNNPYCANCFYSFLEEEKMLVFTSDSDTKHIKDILLQDYVAGSIVLETSIVGKIQGIQFTGKIFEPHDEILKIAKKSYLKRFPFAVLMNTKLWVVKLSFVKLTDNRLGFGKKLIWEEND